MTARPNLIAVIGQQRSGTTVFRQMLGSYPTAIDLGEIFSGWTDLRNNFWGFIGRSGSDNRHFVCPHHWYDAWESYIFDQKVFHGADNLVFDVKLEHLGHLFRHDPFSIPHVSHYPFSWDRMKVIILERRNIAAQIVSRKRAEATNDWGWRDSKASRHQLMRHDARFLLAAETTGRASSERADRGGSHTSEAELSADATAFSSDDDAGKLYIDARQLETEILSCTAANQFAREKMNDFGPLHLAYEDFFDCDGLFSTALVDVVSEFLSFDAQEVLRRPVMLKQSSDDFLDVIVNGDEIRDYFSRTPLGWMFEPTASAEV